MYRKGDNVRTVARINIELPDDLHRRAKAAAALAGQTLKDFICEAVERATEDARKGRP